MHLINFIIWSPNPEIFPGINWIPVRWYGLLFALGFVISQQIMYKIYRTESKPVKDVDSLTLYMIIATIIGARLGHVLFYEPLRYLKDPITILETWQGGLASHGAAIGILTGIWLYSNYLIDINLFKWHFVWKKRKREGQSFLYVVDRIVICVALTGCLIRFGNFVNSEIIGIPTHNGKGVVFARDVVERLEYMNEVNHVSVTKDPPEKVDEQGHVPVNIIVDFSNKVRDENMASTIVKSNIKTILSGYEYVRLHIDEPVDHPIQYKINKQSNGNLEAVIQTKAIPRHPAQLYESISSLLIFFLLFYLWSGKKGELMEGKLFGIFLIAIFTLRFIYEFVKENQVPFENKIPLNMGQWLSIPLILIGIYVLLNLKKFQPKK